MEERPPVPRCSNVTGREELSRAKTCGCERGRWGMPRQRRLGGADRAERPRMESAWSAAARAGNGVRASRTLFASPRACLAASTAAAGYPRGTARWSCLVDSIVRRTVTRGAPNPRAEADQRGWRIFFRRRLANSLRTLGRRTRTNRPNARVITTQNSHDRNELDSIREAPSHSSPPLLPRASSRLPWPARPAPARRRAASPWARPRWRRARPPGT